MTYLPGQPLSGKTKIGESFSTWLYLITDFPLSCLLKPFKPFNSTLTHLFTSLPFFGDQHIVSLANMLQISKSLATVSITANGFVRAHSVQQLADSLMVNKTVNDLLLSGNAWGDDAVRILAGYLKMTESLSSLNLNFSDVGDAGAKALAKVLGTNNTLDSLSLLKNPGIIISNPSVMSLCEALKVNTTVSSLDLSETGIIVMLLFFLLCKFSKLILAV